jgi:hypothetical protein
MTRPGGSRARDERRLSVADREWRVSEAWRGASGWGVAYFLCLGAEGPDPDDRLDRKALLPPDARLDSLSDEELVALHASAAGLTSTERRFADAEGRAWLAQGRGPVWAEADVAAGLTGLLFTALEGPAERVAVADGRAAHLTDSELRARLIVAREAGVGAGETG